MNRQELIYALRLAQTLGDPTLLRTAVRDVHPADLAEVLEELGTGTAATLLEALPIAESAQLFGYLESRLQLALAEHLDTRALAELLQEMDADERADLYAALPPDRQRQALAVLPEVERADLRKLAAYPDGSVGAVMTTDIATLGADLSAVQAMAQLRRDAPNMETIYDAYVVDSQRRLIGVVSLRDLIMADPAQRIATIMRGQSIHVRADAPRSEAARLIRDYDILALPVINGGDRLVGIVTHDDAMDVAEAEATEDFLKSGGFGLMPGRSDSLAGIGANLRDATISALYRQRIFWLVLLVFGNIFSGAGIAYFEDTITAYVALVFFLPMLIGSGGNAGAQSATLMVRALATGDVVLKDWGRMLGRELLVAILLGLSMGLAVSVVGVLRGGVPIALVVALSMVIIVVVGSLVGMSLPFLLDRLKMDPATASAPLVTSVADVAGVLIYFAIATAVLPDIGLAPG